MLDTLLEQGVLPDRLVRFGIKRLLGQRLRDESANRREGGDSWLTRYADDLKQRPIAEDTRAANDQHYEVPAEFYQLCLGSRLKYSSCLFETGREALDEAEVAMLELYVERAGLADGQAVLELGCGWGSLTLYLAERFPNSRITAVSNSSGQRQLIEREAARRGFRHVRVLTCDMNAFDAAPASFDRVVSIEMFEHMKNYELLLGRIGRWLKPQGRLFVHIFAHRHYAYHFESKGPGDWMARHFFTGGQMPSHELLRYFQRDLRLLSDWKLSGLHYAQTARCWLENMDRHRSSILRVFAETYGAKEARKWWNYWRIFFLSCAELWGYRGGSEWIVSHYLFAPRSP